MKGVGKGIRNEIAVDRNNRGVGASKTNKFGENRAWEARLAIGLQGQKAKNTTFSYQTWSIMRDIVTYLDMIPRRVKVEKMRGSFAERTIFERA